MVRFSAILQGHFTGTIGWDALNISFAPYLTAMTDKEVRQFAQMLIYEFSQLPPRAEDRRFIPICTYIMKCRRTGRVFPLSVPVGKPTGKKYGEYEPDARKFATALMEVFRERRRHGETVYFAASSFAYQR